VPLTVGWIILYPAMILIWIWGKSTSNRLGDLGIPPEAQAFPVWKLAAGFFVNLEFLGGGFNLMHLWFLYYLLLLYGSTLAVRWLIQRIAPIRIMGSLDSLVVWLMRGWWTVPLLAAVTVILIFPMNGVDTPNDTLVPNLPVLLVYGLFFGLGWLIYRQPVVLLEFKRRWFTHLLLGLILVLPTDWDYFSSSQYFPEETFRGLGFLGNWSTGQYLAYNSLYALMMWSFVSGFSGFFLTYFQSENRIWRYVADSSYWLYLVHLLIVVPAQIFLAGWALSPALKYLLINLTVFPILYFSYHYLARSTFIGQQLNGRKYPFSPLCSEAVKPLSKNLWNRDHS